MGVATGTISRWERADGTKPRDYRWKRIRQLWVLNRENKKDKFWKDRKEPVEFMD